MKHIKTFNENKEVQKFDKLMSHYTDKVLNILKTTCFDEQRPKESSISIFDAYNTIARKGNCNSLVNNFTTELLSNKEKSLSKVIRFNYQCIEDLIYDIDIELGLSSKTEKELIEKLTLLLKNEFNLIN